MDSLIRYLIAVVVALVAGVAGWLVTALVAIWIGGLFGMSDFEGGRAMFGFFGVGPLGGLVCMIGGGWLALVWGGRRASAARTLARLGGVLAGVAALVGSAVALRLLTLDVYTNTLPPTLEFEIRVPASMRSPEPRSLRVELHTDKNVDEGLLDDRWSSAEGEQESINGSVALAFKTRSRLLAVTVPGEATRLFRLHLGRDPSSTPALGTWQRADYVESATDGRLRAADRDDPIEIRYRVRRAGE